MRRKRKCTNQDPDNNGRAVERTTKVLKRNEDITISDNTTGDQAENDAERSTENLMTDETKPKTEDYHSEFTLSQSSRMIPIFGKKRERMPAMITDNNGTKIKDDMEKGITDYAIKEDAPPLAESPSESSSTTKTIKQILSQSDDCKNIKTGLPGEASLNLQDKKCTAAADTQQNDSVNIETKNKPVDEKACNSEVKKEVLTDIESPPVEIVDDDVSIVNEFEGSKGECVVVHDKEPKAENAEEVTGTPDNKINDDVLLEGNYKHDDFPEDLVDLTESQWKDLESNERQTSRSFAHLSSHTSTTYMMGTCKPSVAPMVKNDSIQSVVKLLITDVIQLNNMVGRAMREVQSIKASCSKNKRVDLNSFPNSGKG